MKCLKSLLAFSLLVNIPAFAQTQSPPVKDAIGASAQSRAVQIESIRGQIQTAQINLNNLRRELSSSWNGTGYRVRKVSLITAAAGLSLVVIMAANIFKTKTKTVGGVLGKFAVAALGNSALGLGLAGSVASEVVVLFTQSDVDELNRQISSAETDLNQLNQRLSLVQGQN